jgi:CofD-related protein of GAK system
MSGAIDPNRARNPVSGPALLFFSGGTALRNLSRQLVKVSHRSLHVITPFDDGGSSAELRRHFRMLPPGDLRNRMLALADFERPGVRDTYTLLNTRLDRQANPGSLLRVLEEIVAGHHPRTRMLPRERKAPLLRGLGRFLESMPAGFDLRGASVGNLVFTGFYLDHDRDLEGTLAGFGELLSVRGTVHPAADCDLELAAELLDGRVIHSQRGITGREGETIGSPVNRIWTADPLSGQAVSPPPAAPRVLSMIAGADLLVYPYGSFWTSLVASLLPAGIVPALLKTGRPKVWVPSTYEDPELPGIRLEESLDRLLQVLGVEPGSTGASRVLDAVIVDPRNGRYTGGLSSRALKARHVRVIEAELVSPESSPAIDPARLLPLLLQLV